MNDNIYEGSSYKIIVSDCNISIDFTGGVFIRIPSSYSVAAHIILAINSNETSVVDMLVSYIYSNVSIVPDGELFSSFLINMESYIERNRKNIGDQDDDSILEEVRKEYEMFEESIKTANNEDEGTDGN